ncbi:phthalate transporter [Metarhizium rileyi]|uniref:Phthalate transporter n=1 Tax=Metarhizium rileyi (strain RCEF 4871) TaxID=1649241 RepID=A0A167HIL6_METRR|nr:phthalate transporter [Metarhizium rileyi RCEF 4871]
MVTRILSDDPGKATMHNREGLSWAFFKDALLDYHLWPIDLLGRTWSIPVTPPQAYIMLTCKALGFNTFETNLLTIPGYTIFHTALVLDMGLGKGQPALADRSHHPVLGTASTNCSLVALLPALANSNWSKWVLSTLLVGYPYCHAVFVAFTSRNSGSVRT